MYDRGVDGGTTYVDLIGILKEIIWISEVLKLIEICRWVCRFNEGISEELCSIFQTWNQKYPSGSCWSNALKE